MAIIRCTRSPSVNPYVVMATQKVKGCPRQKETLEWKDGVPLDTCKRCKSHARVEDQFLPIYLFYFLAKEKIFNARAYTGESE